jgi:hypothetical protein
MDNSYLPDDYRKILEALTSADRRRFLEGDFAPTEERRILTTIPVKSVTLQRDDGSTFTARQDGRRISVDCEELTDSEIAKLDAFFGTTNGKFDVEPEIGDRFTGQDGRPMIVTAVDPADKTVTARCTLNRRERRAWKAKKRGA